MKPKAVAWREPALGLTIAFLCLAAPGRVRGHCDTMKGPIIPEAQAALDKGDVTPVLKWVKPDHEAEVKAAFAQAVTVRAKGPEAKALADRYFLETLIRLHRAGEGAPFTGIKDEPVDPVAAMADAALAGGSPDKMIKELSAHLAAAVKAKLEKAAVAAKSKEASVEAGRAYVEAYVTYVHYIEAVHAAIAAAGGHGEASAAPAYEHGR